MALISQGRHIDRGSPGDQDLRNGEDNQKSQGRGKILPQIVHESGRSNTLKDRLAFLHSRLGWPFKVRPHALTGGTLRELPKGARTLDEHW